MPTADHRPALPPLRLPRPWTDDIIYMVLVDRFHRAGDGPPPEPPWHGGNLAGVRAKLDYLQELGITALWLSPVYLNQKDGCHGYWPIDFYQVDPRFGTMAELKALVDDCHRRGLKVLLDTVLNHAGYDHPMARDPKYKKWFHRGGEMLLMTQKSLEQNSLHGLPDFAQERPEVAEYLTRMALWWRNQTGCDGFRLDAVKHVPATFWKRFSQAVHESAGPDFLLLGEVFRGVPEYIARYQREDGIDSVFDVPFADTVRSALARDAEAPGVPLLRRVNELRREYRTMLFNEIVRKFLARKPTDLRWFSALRDGERHYTRPELLATFIDNHDLSRFASEAEPAGARLRMALALLFTWRGIPAITYGTEVGLHGHTEGSNRKPMEFGADPELTAYVRKLIALRRTVPALTAGPVVELHADREYYAFLRDAGESRVLVALNNSHHPQRRELQLPAWRGWNGELTDALDGTVHPVRDGKLGLTLPPRHCAILVRGAGLPR